MKDKDGFLKRFGEYKIIKRIAKSSFGKIYLAKKSDKLYAIKEYNHMRNKSRLDDEIKIVSFLSKKFNLHKFYEYKKISNKFYTIFDYANDGDLDKYINKNKKISEEKTIEIIKSILETLEYAHKHNIIHLDIKADNIFINDSKYFLCDWGVSKIIKEFSILDISGDDNYVAPEVYITGKVNNKYDIYSLGCMIYHMLTGNEVYGFDKNTLDVEKIYSHTSLDLNYTEEISLKMRYLISRMLCKNPDKRADLVEIIEILNDKIKPLEVESNYIKYHDYDDKFKYYEIMAKNGYVYAQNILAIFYEEGRYITKNNKIALFWYQKSANNEFVKAQCNLALSYLNGDIVEKNLQKAFYWFKKSDEKGYKVATCHLANMYFNGLYVKRNIIIAKKLYEKAAYKGSKKAYLTIKEKYK